MTKLISVEAIARRQYWVGEIQKLSGDFGDDSERLERELATEISREGYKVLIDHLRTCGAIPESYGHDSSEEKLYSKYTDCLLAETFRSIGFESLVLRERSDVADVEVFAETYSFVADAKSFRLSRTAKNQKDFKVQAMDGWKRGKPFAMVVCPIYQLPAKSSQIYEQASSRNVCIFTYSHLALIVAFSIIEGSARAAELIQEVFKVISALNPSKAAYSYWLPLNKTILGYSSVLNDLWQAEKQAAVESIALAKEEGLIYLMSHRERIMQLSREEAIASLLTVYKIESRMKTIESISANRILDIR